MKPIKKEEIMIPDIDKQEVNEIIGLINKVIKERKVELNKYEHTCINPIHEFSQPFFGSYETENIIKALQRFHEEGDFAIWIARDPEDDIDLIDINLDVNELFPEELEFDFINQKGWYKKHLNPVYEQNEMMGRKVHEGMKIHLREDWSIKSIGGCPMFDGDYVYEVNNIRKNFVGLTVFDLKQLKPRKGTNKFRILDYLYKRK